MIRFDSASGDVKPKRYIETESSAPRCNNLQICYASVRFRPAPLGSEKFAISREGLRPEAKQFRASDNDEGGAAHLQLPLRRFSEVWLIRPDCNVAESAFHSFGVTRQRANPSSHARSSRLHAVREPTTHHADRTRPDTIVQWKHHPARDIHDCPRIRGCTGVNDRTRAPWPTGDDSPYPDRWTPPRRA